MTFVFSRISVGAHISDIQGSFREILEDIIKILLDLIGGLGRLSFHDMETHASLPSASTLSVDHGAVARAFGEEARSVWVFRDDIDRDGHGKISCHDVQSNKFIDLPRSHSRDKGTI
jgi:hypothetical protein